MLPKLPNPRRYHTILKSLNEHITFLYSTVPPIQTGLSIRISIFGRIDLGHSIPIVFHPITIRRISMFFNIRHVCFFVFANILYGVNALIAVNKLVERIFIWLNILPNKRNSKITCFLKLDRRLCSVKVDVLQRGHRNLAPKRIQSLWKIQKGNPRMKFHLSIIDKRLQRNRMGSKPNILEVFTS